MNRFQQVFTLTYQHDHPDDVPVEIETAVKCRLKTFLLWNPINEFLVFEVFFSLIFEPLKKLLKCCLQVYRTFKINVTLHALYKRSVGDIYEVETFQFKTRNEAVYSQFGLNSKINGWISQLLSESEEFEKRGSGWQLERIYGLEIRVNKTNVLRAAGYIPLPQKIQQKRAVINIKNNDNLCFMYSILCRFVETNPQRVIKYRNPKLLRKYNFSGLSFPVPIHQIFF